MSKFILSSSEPGSELNKFCILDVRADDTDARDYIFQPSLTLLPEIFDNRGKKGLYAFAIVGYTPYGFIIQNS